MEITAPLIVAMLCGIVGLLGLKFVDVRERALLSRLFLAAFGLRLAFAFLFYGLGLVNMLGGADDVVWAQMWQRSRFWETSGPESLRTIYNINNLQANPGWSYFGAYFYYWLNMQSQMALACLNCFLNALVVVVIYITAREFFDARASTFVAWIAVVMPTFLIWSVLTVKETWLILFEISTFYAMWRLNRERNPVHALLYGLLAITLILLTLSFRYYVAGFLVGGVIVSVTCIRAQQPVRAASYGVVVIGLLYITLNAVNIMQFDLESITQARLKEMTSFRVNVSDVEQVGTGSAVQFDFDTTTPLGATMMLLAGSAYVLLSPFPWEVRSFSQAAALPDVLLWWWLVIAFVVPGIRFAWHKQQAMVLSIAAFVLPLFLFYAFMFGNVGLAYRQRAQLIPFLLLLAAAGYEGRQRETRQGSRARFVTGSSRPKLPSASAVISPTSISK